MSIPRSIGGSPLSRVEGEGSLRLEIRDGAVERAALEIFEPPRLFEALLRGRRHTEAPDITARICGICPVAYQLSACAAIEDACGVTVPDAVADLRRLLYCGEWIQSHALHIYLLHAPDFLGCPDAVALAQDHRSDVERGLRLKRVGNTIMETVGGRAIHPVNVRVGGFYRSPDPDQIQALVEPLRRALDDAVATTEWVSTFEFPDFERGYRFVSLAGGPDYPMDAGRASTPGRVRSSAGGLDTGAAGYSTAVIEEQVAHSTALHARLFGRDPYLTGPLARYAQNRERVTPVARDSAARVGLGAVVRNPFRSIQVRSVELVIACEEALRLAQTYRPPEPSAVPVPPRAGIGHGMTEAPRGILLHRYELDAEGIILSARIVPPTSQNQLTIEEDLRTVAQRFLDRSDAELTARCEQAVRNHDPCISCAAHFLDLRREAGR